MFSKNLAIILALSCLAASPVFAAGVDADRDAGKDGHVVTDKDKDHADDAAVSRDQGTDPKRQDKDAADVAARRDGTDHSTTVKNALDAAAAKIKAAKDAAAKAGAPKTASDAQARKNDLQVALVNAMLGVHGVLKDIDTRIGSKDEAAFEALYGENSSNGKLFLDNVSKLHDGLKDLIGDLKGDSLTRAEKMVRAFRDNLIGLGKRNSKASVDTLSDAIKAYAKSVAGDNWAEIEHDSASLMLKNTNLAERDAKFQATVNYLGVKHPEMDEKTKEDLARQIVDEQEGRKPCV